MPWFSNQPDKQPPVADAAATAALHTLETLQAMQHELARLRATQDVIAQTLISVAGVIDEQAVAGQTTVGVVLGLMRMMQMEHGYPDTAFGPPKMSDLA